MKLNMIVGKKQIVLASLILILGVAVYINRRAVFKFVFGF